MKMLLIAILAVIATSASATVELYDIHDDGGEKQPHWISVEKSENKLTRIQLLAQYKERTVVLFDLDKKSLKKNMIVSASESVLEIKTKSLLKSTLQGSYYHPWGDASIESGHEYNLSINITEGCLTYLEDEYEKCRMELSDQDAGEMAMWGNLVRRK